MNAYQALKKKHQNEMNAFPIRFAFSQDQFNDGMRSLGIEPEGTDKIFSFGNGGFYLKTDSDKLAKMIERFSKEHADAISADATGEGYIFDMFDYELANHEYGYTYDAGPALESLGLTMEVIEQDHRMLKAFNRAKKIEGQK